MHVFTIAESKLKLFNLQNIAAYEEYENRLRQVREQLPSQEQRWSSGAAFGASYLPDHALSHQANDIDPDNMTYEELLQLGEQVGDVKKERWRQMAPQIISRLPTHRWSGDNQADVSYVDVHYCAEIVAALTDYVVLKPQVHHLPIFV